jgi:hypothetical protein
MATGAREMVCQVRRQIARIRPRLFGRRLGSRDHRVVINAAWGFVNAWFVYAGADLFMTLVAGRML